MPLVWQRVVDCSARNVQSRYPQSQIYWFAESPTLISREENCGILRYIGATVHTGQVGLGLGSGSSRDRFDSVRLSVALWMVKTARKAENQAWQTHFMIFISCPSQYVVHVWFRHHLLGKVKVKPSHLPPSVCYGAFLVCALRWTFNIDNFPICFSRLTASCVTLAFTFCVWEHRPWPSLSLRSTLLTTPALAGIHRWYWLGDTLLYLRTVL